jgi:hypothetical protein
MTTTEEKEFDLLHSEVEYCNSQIGNYFELQIKIFGFVASAAAVCLGLVFANGGEGAKALSPPTTARVLVALSGVLSFAVLQGVITYSIALGYMGYKSVEVARRLKSLLALSELPLKSVSAVFSGSAGVPLATASSLATFGLLGVNLFVLTYAWSLSYGHPRIHLLVVAAGIGLAASCICVILVLRAARSLSAAVGTRSTKPPPT